MLTAAACAGVRGQDAEMMEQIERDVMRTHPDMHFFSGDDPTATTHREVSAPIPSAQQCIFFVARLQHP